MSIEPPPEPARSLKTAQWLNVLPGAGLGYIGQWDAAIPYLIVGVFGYLAAVFSFGLSLVVVIGAGVLAEQKTKALYNEHHGADLIAAELARRMPTAPPLPAASPQPPVPAPAPSTPPQTAVTAPRPHVADPSAGAAAPGRLPCPRCGERERDSSGWCVTCSALLGGAIAGPDNLVRRLAASLNSRDFDGAYTLLDGRYVQHDVLKGSKLSLRKLKAGLRVLVVTYPDLSWQAEMVATDPSDASIIWVRWLQEGNPRRGAPLAVRAAERFRVDNGLLAESWSYPPLAPEQPMPASTSAPAVSAAPPPPPPPPTSAPVVSAAPPPPPGWHPDPTGQSRLRYWDGAQWTEHTGA